MTYRLLTVAILVLLIAGAVAYVIGGRPRVVYQTAGEIVGLTADDRGLLWLERPRGADTPGGGLYALDDGADQPVCLYSGPRVIAFAPAGDRVLALGVTGNAGSVLSIPRSGGEARLLATPLERPGSIASSDGVAYWTEGREAILDHVPHVPVANPRTLIRSAAVGGHAATRTVVAFEADGDSPDDKLLGVDRGRLCWLDRFGERYSGGWAAVRRVATEGGVTETLTTERSVTNDAVLDEGVLYWTAPSEDAGRPQAFRCVRCVPVSGGEPETLTDWLPSLGQLARSDRKTYYGSSGGVWLVPDELSPPRMVGRPVPGSPQVAARNGRMYQALPAEDGWSLCRRPLTSTGRLIVALGR